MAYTVASSIERFVELHGAAGQTESQAALDTFNTKCDGSIPGWYSDILQRFPICGIELEWPDPSDTDEFVGVEWLGVPSMRSEMFECYPGIAIRKRGYICVAGCTLGSGDQYYICNADGDNPPLYQISHDISDIADKIITDGRGIVFPKLSDLFDTARMA